MKEFSEKRKEVIKDGTTLNALELSRQKHQDIVAGTGHELCAANCALCVKFHLDGDDDVWEVDMCENCPLYLDDNACDDPGSLWRNNDHRGLIEVFDRLIAAEENK